MKSAGCHPRPQATWPRLLSAVGRSVATGVLGRRFAGRGARCVNGATGRERCFTPSERWRRTAFSRGSASAPLPNAVAAFRPLLRRFLRMRRLDDMPRRGPCETAPSSRAAEALSSASAHVDRADGAGRGGRSSQAAAAEARRLEAPRWSDGARPGSGTAGGWPLAYVWKLFWR